MLVPVGVRAITAGALLLAAIEGGSLLDSSIFEAEPMPKSIEWGNLPPPEELTVTTEDGLEIAGYRWAARCERHVALVFFHGNAGNRFHAANFAAPLRRDDVDLIIASYRGYGGNPGKPDEEGLYRDAAAFVEAAVRGEPDKLYIFGFSLGGAVGANVARRYHADGLITLGAFTDLKSAAPRISRAFIPYRFDNRSLASELEMPWLILHGTADEVIPLSHGETLVEAAGSNALLVRLKDAPHRIALDQIADRIWAYTGAITLGSQNSAYGEQTSWNPERELDLGAEWNYLAQPSNCEEVQSPNEESAEHRSPN